MATLGFVALPATSGWKEYVFYGWIPVPAENLPLIRLPFPRIDGLHVITYRAFFDAVSFYLAQRDISDHFHVRSFSVSLHLVSVLFLGCNRFGLCSFVYGEFTGMPLVCVLKKRFLEHERLLVLGEDLIFLFASLTLLYCFWDVLFMPLNLL